MPKWLALLYTPFNGHEGLVRKTLPRLERCFFGRHRDTEFPQKLSDMPSLRPERRVCGVNTQSIGLELGLRIADTRESSACCNPTTCCFFLNDWFHVSTN